MFARGLARRRVAVTFVTRLAHRRAPRELEGVRLLPLLDRLYPIREAARLCVGRQTGFPWIRIHHWRLRLLWQLPLLAAERLLAPRSMDPWQPDPRLVSLAPDVYCTFGVQSHAATVIASARAAGRPCVLVLGSDGDLDQRYTPDSTFISPYGDAGATCWRILRDADAIVAQTPEQQQMLSVRFARTATVIANPIDVAEWDARRSPAAAPRETGGLERFVLWVGRAEDVHKRPQVCLEVARRCPHIDFLMIMNPRDPQVAAAVHRARPANVRILSAVPFARMPAVLARAAALVNTSSLEGFSNLFLQAALSRVPIASLEVGEAFLARLGCGCFAHGRLDTLCAGLDEYWRHGAPQEQLDLARAFVVRHHDLEQQAAALEAVLRQVVHDVHHQPDGS